MSDVRLMQLGGAALNGVLWTLLAALFGASTGALSVMFLVITALTLGCIALVEKQDG